MGQLSHNFEFLNPLTFNATSYAEQLLVMQRNLLTSSVELLFAPLLTKAAETTSRNQMNDVSKPEQSIANILTEKLADPALSFSTAVETAEPLFNMLNEDV